MMPGLTLSEQQAASASTSQPHANPPPVMTSTTPIPVPVPAPLSIPAPAPAPAPFATHEPQDNSRSSSPARPAYSPITPPLNPQALPPRQTYTHTTHTDSVAAPAPLPEPIDFESNPDVLALKSAISVLQMQKRKAERDMVTLSHIKTAALANPSSFIRDLTSNKLRVEGERDPNSKEDSDNRSDSDSEAEPAAEAKVKPLLSDDIAAPSTSSISATTTDWGAIPKPQNIVRCPPINWSQYAVVGESLDKLHNEQVMRPSQGTPAVMTADGHFEFRAGEGKQERYIGVAAPYAPGKDRIDRKIKIPKISSLMEKEKPSDT
ncbi:hypothetical protein GGR57DRAFT_450609 [Xylariaceae sp. FL1272]|nr:hypothetical protein GGR57DRAFT_450609 [Xylariaceae sp. FL1272]